MNQTLTSPRIRGRTLIRAQFVLAFVGAALLCALLDAGLLTWLKIGPPGQKGDLFFVELVILVAGAIIVGSVSLLAPAKARLALPFVFILLAWHTGFQIQLGSDKFVLSVFDVLVPLALFVALIERWYESAPGPTWFSSHWKLMVVFWSFCLWGLVVAIVRNVDVSPLIANMKSLVLYPLILLIVPWCIRSWKQLYLAVALMLTLIVERAADGLHQAALHQVLKFQTLLSNGHVIYRIDGDMAATNQYATYLLTGVLILTAVVAASALSKRTRFALAAPLVLCGLALLLTFSRGAWLGTGVSLVALLFILRPRQGLATLGVVIGLILVLQVLHPGAGSEFLSRAHDYDHSIVQRETYQAIGFQVVLHYPLGAGWGAWFTRTPSGVQPISGFPWYHDDYLQLATEIGLLGVAVVLCILFTILRTGFIASRKSLTVTQNALIAGLTAAFLGMLVQTGTDQFLWHADIAPHIWIVAGLIAAASMLVGADIRRQGQLEDATAITRQATEIAERQSALTASRAEGMGGNS